MTWLDNSFLISRPELSFSVVVCRVDTAKSNVIDSLILLSLSLSLSLSFCKVQQQWQTLMTTYDAVMRWRSTVRNSFSTRNWNPEHGRVRLLISLIPFPFDHNNFRSFLSKKKKILCFWNVRLVRVSENGSAIISSFSLGFYLWLFN